MCRGLLLFAFCLLPALLSAQNVTGSIVGTVVDASGSAIAGAPVRLTSESTAAIRDAAADGDGNFVFNAVPPGSYTVTIEQGGFKKFEKQHIELSASDRLAVGTLTLELGAVTETVVVKAEGQAVQLASGERSNVITSDEVQNLTVINRDFAALAELTPGVVANPGAEVQTFSGNTTFNVLGGRTTGNNILIDGQPTSNSNEGNVNTTTSMDSVATIEVKVSNYSAEFGRKPGASIMAVTKSGTQQFHGSLYYYKRHEQFNANNFFNNRQGIAATPYRFTTVGASVGGPLAIPRLRRGKLFFFVDSEEIREARPKSPQDVTVPTAMERAGDFSQSYSSANKLYVVKDPLTKAPFPGNAVPASRIDPAGKAYLNLLPLPNNFNTAITGGQWNYQYAESLWIPKRDETARLDYNLNPSTTIYGRYGHWWEDQQGAAVSAGNSAWGWLPDHYTALTNSGVLSLTRIVSPSTVLEGNMGVLRFLEAGPPLNQAELAAKDRIATGVHLPQFYPAGNPFNLVPEATFGGVSKAANPSYASRFPLRGAETVFTWNASLSRITGPHTLKLGLYAERFREIKGEQGTFAGNLDFSNDGNNPLDTGYAYSNALLGVLKSYTESSSRLPVYGFTTDLEWYAQDNWKASRRLTLDYGVRFGWSQPWHNPQGAEGGFLPWLFNPAQEVQLIQPVRVGGTRMAMNPATGDILPAVDIGAYVPGVGNPYDGMLDRQFSPAYPQGMRTTGGFKAAPRIGFAYDPFGKGKTAIRGGFGVFYEMHEQDHFSDNMAYNPPLRVDPIIYYTTLGDYIRAAGVRFPGGISGFDPDRHIPRTMNFSFGIQQDIGWKTLLDVAYVGSLSRHLQERTNLNATPLDSNFLPASQDATSPGKPLPPQFLRPYTGYNDIEYYFYGGNSSYHSLQTTLRRRYANRLTYGIVWTWSKAMDYADAAINSSLTSDTTTANVSNLIPWNVWNYGKAGYDHTHVFRGYWTWGMPRGSRLLPGRFSRGVFDNWQLSGIVTFQSGAPQGIGFAQVSAVDITGSTDGARVNVLANPILARGDRGFDQALRTSAFGPPAVGTWGNAPKDVFRGPGMNNWDTSLFKNVPLHGERWRLQVRFEAYNIFNHTQFSAVDTTARFDTSGKQVSPSFGQYSAAVYPRRMQMALRVTF